MLFVVHFFRELLSLQGILFPELCRKSNNFFFFLEGKSLRKVLRWSGKVLLSFLFCFLRYYSFYFNSIPFHYFLLLPRLLFHCFFLSCFGFSEVHFFSCLYWTLLKKEKKLTFFSVLLSGFHFFFKDRKMLRGKKRKKKKKLKGGLLWVTRSTLSITERLLSFFLIFYLLFGW